MPAEQEFQPTAQTPYTKVPLRGDFPRSCQIGPRKWDGVFRKTAQRFIFVHLHRTGGTTMRMEILYKCADPATIFSVSGAEPPVRGGTTDDLLNMPRKEQEKLRFIVGHMPFGISEYLPWPESWHYVTYLREPMPRAVSEYYQVRHNPLNPCHENGMKYSLEEYIRLQCGTSWNGMCRALSNESFGRKFATQEAMVQEAIRNVELCSSVGFVEHFDESVRHLCRLCGWQIPKYEPKHILTPKGKTLSSSEQELVRASTLLDQKLYDHFHERFLQQSSERSSIRSLLLDKLFGGKRRSAA